MDFELQPDKAERLEVFTHNKPKENKHALPENDSKKIPGTSV
jgi:hypothetical protein